MPPPDQSRPGVLGRGRTGNLRTSLLTVVLVASLAASVAGCNTACPLGLAEGVLVREGDTLVLQGTNGDTMGVHWPSGYGVRDDGGTLVLVDWLGGVKAREGDRIQVGGGARDDGSVDACGDVVVVPRSSPVETPG
jgi:hypothetical protein